MPEENSNNSTLKTLTVARQAFFIGSLFILGGVIGSLLWNQYFILLPILVSCGLMISSLFGWCPMVFILERMPWNKK